MFRSQTRSVLFVLLVFGVLTSQPNVSYAQLDSKEPSQTKQPKNNKQEKLRQEIHRLLSSIKTTKQLAQHVDFDHYFDLICQTAGTPLLTKEQRKKALEIAQKRIRAQKAGGLDWTSVQIQKIVPLEDTNKWLVYCRHSSAADQNKIPMRWWIIKKGKQLWIYDYEVLQIGLRMSMIGTALATDLRNRSVPNWIRALPFLRLVGSAIARKDLVSAEKQLLAVKDINFPAKIEGVRWLYYGVIADARRNFTQALDYFAKAEHHNPDIPIIQFNRAMIYSEVGNYKKALRSLRLYARLLVESEETWYLRGFALAQLGKSNEAIVALKRSLQMDGQYIASVNFLRKYLPKDKKAECVGPFLRLKFRANSFKFLAREAMQDQDAIGLQVLSHAMHKQQPKWALPMYYLAEGYALQKQYRRALPYFLKAVQNETDTKNRNLYLDEMCVFMARGGLALETYRQSPDKQVVFRILTKELDRYRRQKQLQPLLQLRLKTHPQDALAIYYLGRIALDNKQWLKASKQLAVLSLSKVNASVRFKFLNDYVYASYKANRGLQAYKQCDLPKLVFPELVRWYVINQANWPKLRELIRVHKQKFPTDKNIFVWEAELSWLSKKYRDFVKHVVQNRQALYTGRYAYKLYPRLFETLYKLKQKQQITQEIAWLIDQENPKAWGYLHSVFRMLRSRKLTTEAMHFASLCRQTDPQHPDALILFARAHIMTDQYTKAVTYFRNACELQTNQLTRKNYQSNVLYDLIDKGKVLLAYRSAPDTLQAFNTITADLLRQRKYNVLRKILDLHEVKHPQDPWLYYCEGELALAKKNYQEAEDWFADAAKKKTPRLLQSRLRRALQSVRFQLYGAAVTYQFDPSLNTFTDIAYRCREPEHAQHLHYLIQIHKKYFPNDRHIPQWEIEVPWLRKEYQKTLALLKKHKQFIYTNRLSVWKYRDRLLRSLLRLKRFPEVRKVLDTEKQNGSEQYLFEIIYHAYRGDTKATIAAMQRSKKRFYSTGTFYRDPDLGPLLRSPHFRDVRQQFPEPKYTKKKKS